MQELKKLLELPHGLATFTNSELYYIISNLLGCGDFDDVMISQERLYICTEHEPYVMFFFVETFPAGTSQCQRLATCFHVGRIDEDFEEILLFTSGPITDSSVSADATHYDSLYINELLDIKKQGFQRALKPLKFIDGLIRLIGKVDMRTRKVNELFTIVSNDNIKSGLRQEFRLKAGYDSNSGKPYSFDGLYYQVASPVPGWENTGTVVYNYRVREGEYDGDPGFVDTDEVVLMNLKQIF